MSSLAVLGVVFCGVVVSCRLKLAILSLFFFSALNSVYVVEMGLCPVVSVSMSSSHSGFPIGAPTRVSPSLFSLLSCACKIVCLSVELLMERGLRPSWKKNYE